MDEILKEIKEDVKEARKQLIEIVKHQAVMNQSLIEHERRSTNLETRVIPLEKDYAFRSRLFTVLAAVGAIVAAIAETIRALR